MEKSKSGTGGVGFSGLLQITFIVLKLCGVIKWSWLWVLAPTWIAGAVVCLLLLVWIVLSLICS